MALLILFALLAAPIIEIATFIQVGGALGVWPTLGLTLVTAIVGAGLLRYQGLRTLYKVRENLDRGVFPVDDAFDGFFVVIAGALLLTPGFVTDGIGLLLFVPAIRALIKHALRRNMVVINAHVDTHPRQGGRTQMGPDGAPTIEGEFTDITTPSDGPDNTGRSGSGNTRLPPS